MSDELTWPKDVVRSLCRLAEECRCLWDPRMMTTKHKLRTKLFSDIALEIKTRYPIMSSLTGDQARVKFKKLKSYFLREHKKIQSAPSGSAGKISAKWEFHDCLAFLSPSSEEFLSEASRSGPAHHKTFPLQPAPSSPSPILASSAPTSPVQPTRQPQGHELSQSAMKRRRAKAYDTALDVAPPAPSFSKSVSAVVENTINVVPPQLQTKLGFAILQSTNQLLEKLKEKYNFPAALLPLIHFGSNPRSKLQTVRPEDDAANHLYMKMMREKVNLNKGVPQNVTECQATLKPVNKNPIARKRTTQEILEDKENNSADESDVDNVTIKEEHIEVKEEYLEEDIIEIKEEPLEDTADEQEAAETEESEGSGRRGEKRTLSRSCSPEAAPDAKKQQPEVEEVRIENEPAFDKTEVALNWSLENHHTPKRTANWSKVEVFLLLQLIKERKRIIKGKFSPNLTIQHKQQAWVEVTMILNAAFPSVCRTKEQVEKKWHDILTKWKQGFGARNQHNTKTRGGPPERTDGGVLTDATPDIPGKDNVCVSGVPVNAPTDAAEPLLQEKDRMDYEVILEVPDDAATTCSVPVPIQLQTAAATTVKFHHRMDYEVILEVPDDATTTCSVPVPTQLQTAAATTTVKVHHRMDYEVILEVLDDATTTCSVPVPTLLQTAAATTTVTLHHRMDYEVILEVLDDATTTCSVPVPTQLQTAAATTTVHIPQEVAAAPENVSNGNPPEPPVDPVLETVMNSGHHKKQVRELLTQMREASRARMVAWQAFEAYFS